MFRNDVDLHATVNHIDAALGFSSQRVKGIKFCNIAFFQRLDHSHHHTDGRAPLGWIGRMGRNPPSPAPPAHHSIVRHHQFEPGWFADNCARRAPAKGGQLPLGKGAHPRLANFLVEGEKQGDIVSPFSNPGITLQSPEHGSPTALGITSAPTI